MKNTNSFLSGSALHHLCTAFRARYVGSETVVGKFPAHRQGQLVSITLCIQVLLIRPTCVSHLFITERGTDPPYYTGLHSVPLGFLDPKVLLSSRPGNLPERQVHPLASSQSYKQDREWWFLRTCAFRWRYSGYFTKAPSRPPVSRVFSKNKRQSS